MTERLAGACARHPWRTLVAWVGAVVVALMITGALLGAGLSTEIRITTDADSVRALDLKDERLSDRRAPTELIVVSAGDSTIAEPAAARALVQLVGDVSASDAVDEVLFDPRAPAPGQVSADRRSVLVPVRVTEPEEDNIDALVDLVNSADGRDGLAVAITGEHTLARDFNQIAARDLQRGEFQIGFPAAAIVLILVFGALVAAALPLIMAIMSIAVALGLTALIAQGFELSVFVVNMIVAMGLALGIDYALFVLSRVREERARGRDRASAISVSAATASRAVLFSGSAFVLAMTGLLLVPNTVMRSLAAGAIVVGIIAIISALTLLPALLALLGDRVNSLKVPYIGRRVERSGAQEGRFWVRIVRRVTARPGVSLGLSATVLIVAAAPLLTMNIGATGAEIMPDRAEAKQGFIAIDAAFPGASAEPAEVIVDGPVDAPGVRESFQRLQAALADDPAYGTTELIEYGDRDLTVLRVPIGADALSDSALSAVRELRDDHVPTAFPDTEALVGGATALNIDYFAVMERWLPLVIIFVLALSFVLLTVAFRSVVIAATSIAMNLLSVGAAYGLLVLVFQHGWGASLLGFQQVDIIEAWVPLFLFAVLFGLSMDYQVFLLSRIRERYTERGDTRDAVVFGIGSTARIITGAALIIVAVFSGFAAGELVMFQQMGFGVAAALIIDATIVRSVLVPATMTLLGRHNWYLPHWLEWLPRIEVEGAAATRGADGHEMPGATPRPPAG